uniref:X1.A3.2 n=1 Tax=Schmidtea mediterranea TaxID=79327 RepID=V9XTD5_SCHMD|nr:X1.A3.2 [Schmidtea mediterranea]
MASNDSKRNSKVFSVSSSQWINHCRNSIELIEPSEEADQFRLNRVSKIDDGLIDSNEDFKKLLKSCIALLLQSILLISMDIVQLSNSCLSIAYFPGLICGFITLTGAGLSAIILSYNLLRYSQLFIVLTLSVHITIILSYVIEILLFLFLLPNKIGHCNTLMQVLISVSPISSLLFGIPFAFVSAFIYYTIYKTIVSVS